MLLYLLLLYPLLLFLLPFFLVPVLPLLQVQQETPAKKARLQCDVDNNLITSTTPSTNTPNKTIPRVGRRGSLNGRKWPLWPSLGFVSTARVADSKQTFGSSEATNHDRSTEKANGSLEETTGVEVASPPRTTLLGTIFSPVFNFFSPAKNG